MVSKIGEEWSSKEGEKVKVIDYISRDNCTIQFPCGLLMYKVNYRSLIKNRIKKFVDRVGETFITNEGYKVKILKYISCKNVSVIFDSGYIVNNLTYTSVQKGYVKNVYHKTAYGVGYFGEGIYKSRGNHREYYLKWIDLIKRCYSEKFQKIHSSYKSCSVSEEWHNFQNFAEWMEQNYNPETMKGWHLDKDILVKSNKVYSESTCCFVPHEINMLFIKKVKRVNSLPIGVGIFKNKYTANISMDNKSSTLGYFDTIEEAFQSYKIAKEGHIMRVANRWKGKITEQVYQALINYQVEITD